MVQTINASEFLEEESNKEIIFSAELSEFDGKVRKKDYFIFKLSIDLIVKSATNISF